MRVCNRKEVCGAQVRAERVGEHLEARAEYAGRLEAEHCALGAHDVQRVRHDHRHDAQVLAQLVRQRAHRHAVRVALATDAAAAARERVVREEQCHRVAQTEL